MFISTVAKKRTSISIQLSMKSWSIMLKAFVAYVAPRNASVQSHIANIEQLERMYVSIILINGGKPITTTDKGLAFCYWLLCHQTTVGYGMYYNKRSSHNVIRGFGCRGFPPLKKGSAHSSD